MRLLYLLLFSVNVFSQQGSYFNQPPPKAGATLFAPNIVSDEFGNRDMAISPKGDELFYTLQYRGGFVFSTIMHSHVINGKWSTPEVAVFSGLYNDLEPAFSPDGETLYFSSARPVTGDKNKDYDLWFVKKQQGKWLLPQKMDSPVNSDKDEFYPSVAINGNIYFTREMDGKGEDIVMCRFSNNRYDSAISLPAAVNSVGGEFNAFVDPNEQYIIFTGYKRKGNIGSGDLYISFKDEGGEWAATRNLGDKINGAGLTYCPYISPDKKYFFFTTSRGIFKTPFESPQNLNALRTLISNPLNGWDNIYWIDAGSVIVK